MVAKKEIERSSICARTSKFCNGFFGRLATSAMSWPAILLKPRYQSNVFKRVEIINYEHFEARAKNPSGCLGLNLRSSEKW